MPLRQSAGQRTYEQLRAAILDGSLPEGRLDIQQIADRLRVSPTPVREALARLASEHLVVFTPGRGYAIAAPSSDTLHDLYAWTDRLILLALEDASERPPTSHHAAPSHWRAGGGGEAARYAEAASMFFFDIARTHPNGEYSDKIAQSNDRLFQARAAEWVVLSHPNQELSHLVSLWRAGAFDALRTGVGAYHQVRLSNIDRISETLARSPVALHD